MLDLLHRPSIVKSIPDFMPGNPHGPFGSRLGVRFGELQAVRPEELCPLRIADGDSLTVTKNLLSPANNELGVHTERKLRCCM